MDLSWCEIYQSLSNLNSHIMQFAKLFLDRL